MAKNNIDEGKLCAVLSYILIGIIWYFVDEKMKKNAFAKFHVKQSIVLLIVDIVLMIALTILGIITFGFIAIIGWVLWLGLFVLWIFGVAYALTGQQKEIPVIGGFAKNLNF